MPDSPEVSITPLADALLRVETLLRRFSSCQYQDATRKSVCWQHPSGHRHGPVRMRDGKPDPLCVGNHHQFVPGGSIAELERALEAVRQAYVGEQLDRALAEGEV